VACVFVGGIGAAIVQCMAVCCGVLQCDAVCYGVL